MNNTFTVYYHTFPDGKIYVGITKLNVEDRWKNGNGYYGQAVYEPILQYGWENIRHDIYITNISEQEARDIEHSLILEWNTLMPNGWNKSDGGYYNNADIFNKEVSQYDITGKLIQTFPSQREASYAMINKYSTSICMACKEKLILAFGYQWRYGHEPQIKPIAANKKITYLIDQFSLQGEYLGTHKNATQAARLFTDSPRAGNHILQVCRGERNIAYGYQWRFHLKDSKCESIINLQKEKEVSCYNLNGQLIQTFSSLAQAAKYYNIDDGAISECCHGKLKTAYNKYWCFGHNNKIEIIKPKAGKNGGKTIYQYDAKTRLLLNEFQSTSMAAQKICPGSASNISRTAIGKGKTCHGYLWSYLKFEKAPENLQQLNQNLYIKEKEDSQNE